MRITAKVDITLNEKEDGGSREIVNLMERGLLEIGHMGQEFLIHVDLRKPSLYLVAEFDDGGRPQAAPTKGE